jgi:hypothetical protein
MRHAISALTVATLLLAAAPAHAKLPPASDEAKAKAAGAAAKSAWSDKVAGFKLWGGRGRAAHAGVPPAVETPACADPGPFVEPVPVSGPATVPAVAATAPAAAPKK